MKAHPDLNDELNRRAFAATLPFFARSRRRSTSPATNTFAGFLKGDEGARRGPPIDSYASNRRAE